MDIQVYFLVLSEKIKSKVNKDQELRFGTAHLAHSCNKLAVAMLNKYKQTKMN